MKKESKETDIELLINGEVVPMNPFVKSIFESTLNGMVSCLKGVSEVKDLRLTLRRKV